MEQQILEFLKSRNPSLCVLSTVTPDGKSESALVAYAVHDDLSIIFSTHTTTRKWENLKHNSHVSVVIGWEFTSMSIQYEGVARLIELDEDFSKQEEFFYSQRPETKKFKSETTAYIYVKPNWIRATDLSQHPPRIEEKTY